MILQAQSALKTGSWDLTHDVKRALVKVRVEIAKKQQENKSYIDNILNCRIIDPNTENPETLESLLQNKLTNNDRKIMSLKVGSIRICLNQHYP